MKQIFTEIAYDKWFDGLRDRNAKLRISQRLARIERTGELGDAKSLGEGLSELRFTFGPGYRIYFIEDGDTIIILLGGGDKDSQKRDIDKARAAIADELPPRQENKEQPNGKT
jgi:putative addiction module killer protein